MPIVIAIIELR